MNPATATVIGIALSLPALHLAVDTPPSLMSRADRAAELGAIRAEARLALARCRTAGPQERAICRAEARASERIAAAALEARYRGTLLAQEEALREQSRALHGLAEARRLVRPI